MPFELNKRLAAEIGQFMWKVPVGNAIASRQWGGPGLMMGSVFAQMKRGEDDGIVKLDAFKEKVSSSAEDPGEWEGLGKETFRKIVNLPKTKAALNKELGSAPIGFRCNQFAAAMIYLIKLNRNFETTAEIIRMGESTSNCHYIVVLGRDKTTSGADIVSNNKDTWGAEHILLDPWGAKQRKHLLTWVTEENGTSGPGGKFFISPREFGNKMFPVCEWRLPNPRYI